MERSFFRYLCPFHLYYSKGVKKKFQEAVRLAKKDCNVKVPYYIHRYIYLTIKNINIS